MSRALPYLLMVVHCPFPAVFFRIQVLDAFTATFDFSSLTFDAGLRCYMASFKLPGVYCCCVKTISVLVVTDTA